MNVSHQEQTPHNREARLWDAVIVGAGPAGTVAARQLALTGHRVLLVEKKSFPRPKVCGGCLNARAISALNLARLADVPRQAEATPLNCVEIRGHRSTARIALPAGCCAVSRAALDEALVTEAIASGVYFVPQTTARMEENDGHAHRSVHLQGSSDVCVRAKVVIAADGLQHSSVSPLGSFQSDVDGKSHVGLGATFTDDTYDLPPNTVRMCIGREGYVGIVRVEKNMLNVAAALSPSLLRRCGTPDAAIAAILAETKTTPLVNLVAHAWQGTPPVTRATKCLAANRLFLIGDATGYVEPFTGEGMSWAIESALQVAPLADACIRATESPEILATQWQKSQRKRLLSRQAVCRWIAWGLRRPMIAHLGLTLSQMFPGITSRVVHAMNRPVDNLSMVADRFPRSPIACESQ